MLLFALPATADDRTDLAAARAVFDRNIEAIRERDRATYLALYLASDRLVRTGAEGLTTGFDEFSREAGRWPDSIEATDVRLTPLRPGLVYGTYRYRVRYGGNEHSGISERLFVETADGWKIARTGAIDTPPGTPPPPIAIVGATMIDGRGGPPVPNAVVIVRGGRIDCAGACSIPSGVEVIDAKGLWLTPGLVDAHVHFSQTGWADGRPDALDVREVHPYIDTQAALRAHPERFGRTYLCSGVTSVFDAGGYPWTLQLADRLAHDTTTPRVAAAGPLLSTLDFWLNQPAERQFMHLTESSAPHGVRYLAANGSKAVKVWFIVRPPELTAAASEAAVIAAGAEARKRGLPLIVHATGLAAAKAAVRAGAKLLVHNVWDDAIDEELVALLRSNGTIVNPTLTVMGGYVRMFRSAVTKTPPPVDDPNGCVDPETLAKLRSTPEAGIKATAEQLAAREKSTAERERLSLANFRRLIANGIPIATGTDAGNPLTLHGTSIYAEMEAMQAAGMTPMQVIVSSTAVAARAAGIDSSTGTVERGKHADLLLVGADPSADVANFRKVHSVVRGGVLRPLSDLSALAQNPQK